MQRIFVGDVQGCADELDELLGRARDAFGDEFELWVVGDLICRGPHSLRALTRVRELIEAGRARYVLGNHELGFMLTHLGLRTQKPQDRLEELLASREVEEWIHWLRQRPLVETGELAGQPFAMVHAAVHPDWKLAKLEKRAQRAAARLAEGDLEQLHAFLSPALVADEDRDLVDRLTRCRSVDGSDGWSSQEPDDSSVAWHHRWTRRGHDYGVVYGHWALQLLHVAPGLRGLDTGCVHHGRGHDGYLTAWLPEWSAASARNASLRPFDLPDDRFWQVRARRAYYGEAS
jgi:bis(5'-nucleosyl)-tetraphosphatase (symmetrical)